MITAEQSIHHAAAKPMSERVFGLFMGLVLSVVSLAPLVIHKPLNPRLLSLALSLAALALLSPSLLKWPMRIWLFITHKISLVVNFVLLGIMFYVVVTPVAFLFRLMGRDPLKRKLDLAAPSYWLARPSEPVAKSMQNQF